MGMEGIGNFPSFGVGSVGSTRSDAERRNRRDADFTTADPRAAFDSELDSMLGDAASFSEAGRAQAAQSLRGVSTPQSSPQSTRKDTDTYTSSKAVPVVTYNASGRLSGGTPVTSAPITGGSTLASQPTAVPVGAEGTEASGEEIAKSTDPKAAEESGASAAAAASKSSSKVDGKLSKGEEEQVRKLQQRDAEVRTHEQAHQATGGEHAGGVSYSYQSGPDNRQYAVGGSVPIDVSPVAGDPEATVQKAEKVRAAAMAPASPSGQDQAVAAKASQMASKARAEQAEEGLNPDKDDKKSGKIGDSKKSDNASDSATPDDNPESVSKAEKAAASGITGLATGASAESRTESRAVEQTDKSREASKIGAGVAAPGQAVAASPVGQPRPTQTVDSMDSSRNSDSSREAQFSPAAQATRAAFTAMSSLNSLHQSTGSTETNRTDHTRPDASNARAMNRAVSAYARTRGETGISLGGSGISMAV